VLVDKAQDERSKVNVWLKRLNTPQQPPQSDVADVKDQSDELAKAAQGSSPKAPLALWPEPSKGGAEESEADASARDRLLQLQPPSAAGPTPLVTEEIFIIDADRVAELRDLESQLRRLLDQEAAHGHGRRASAGHPQQQAPGSAGNARRDFELAAEQLSALDLSAGSAKLWSPSQVGQFASALSTFTRLMDLCKGTGRLTTRNSSSKDIDRRRLVATLVDLQLIDAVSASLEQLLFDPGFEAASSARAHADAAMLWAFLHGLVPFADENSLLLAAGDKLLLQCMQRLQRMLAPPLPRSLAAADPSPSSSPPSGGGVIARLLQTPSASEGDLRMQLPALRLLQQLFDAHPKLVEVLMHAPAPPSPSSSTTTPQHQQQQQQQSPATFYVAFLLREAVCFYQASCGDPSSACSDLCELHVGLLHSLVRSGLPAVSSAARELGVLEHLLLEELAREEEERQQRCSDEANAAAAADEEARMGGRGGEDADSDLESANSAWEEDEEEEMKGRGGGAASRRGKRQVARPEVDAAAASEQARNFKFSYDLNEDLERMLELEEKTGECCLGLRVCVLCVCVDGGWWVVDGVLDGRVGL
jgi:hypothetical protein